MNRPSASEYSAATAAASVGVKIPPKIPPMMITGVTRASEARLNDAQSSQRLARGWRSMLRFRAQK